MVKWKSDGTFSWEPETNLSPAVKKLADEFDKASRKTGKKKGMKRTGQVISAEEAAKETGQAPATVHEPC